MNLHGRLDALHRRAREAGYFTGAEPCLSCGWPRPKAPWFVEIECDGQPRTCTACGHHVDETGEALGGSKTTIVLVGLRLAQS